MRRSVPRCVAIPSDSISRHSIEIAPRKVAIGICRLNNDEEVVFPPFFAGGGRNDLLRQERRAATAESATDRDSPFRIACTSAAHSISSSRVVAKMRPFGTLLGSRGARSGRCAAAPQRWSAENRSGRPDRPNRCRCRVPGTPWQRQREFAGLQSLFRIRGAARATSFRGAPGPRPIAKPLCSVDEPLVLPVGAC